MKLLGKITKYNGKFGTIKLANNEEIDFEYKDISFNQNININDIVEFRLPNIKIARNINVIHQ